MVAVWQSVSSLTAINSADPVVTKPSGTVDGDLLVAVTVFNSDTVTAPAGWTMHAASLGNNHRLWWKIAASEPANYTFTVTGTFAAGMVVIARYNNQAASSPIDVAAGVTVAAGSTPVVIPTVTPTGSNRLLAQIATRFTNTSFTPPGTATERWDIQASANGYTSAGGDEVVGAGATGSRTWTPAHTTTIANGYMFAIKPIPPATGSFTGAYDFTGTGFMGAAGPGQGSFTGGYAFAGSGFNGAAGPSQGSFTGAYDFSGSDFVGVAGAPTAYGAFTGDYEFNGSGFTGEGGAADYLIDVYGTEGGRRRFGGRK